MVDATISRVRLRVLARLGRCGTAAPGGAGRRRACASPRRTISRPAVGDLMTSPI
jgi:hypothetical protein